MHKVLNSCFNSSSSASCNSPFVMFSLPTQYWYCLNLEKNQNIFFHGLLLSLLLWLTIKMSRYRRYASLLLLRLHLRRYLNRFLRVLKAVLKSSYLLYFRSEMPPENFSNEIFQKRFEKKSSTVSNLRTLTSGFEG